MRKIIPFLIFFLTSFLLRAQSGVSDTSAVVAATAPVKFLYDSQRGNESGIYNGILYYNYSSEIEGIPYYQSPEWHKGTVLFENILYKDIMMRYELISGQLIVTTDTVSGVYICLFSPRVKEFSYGGMNFIRLTKADAPSSPANGFYRVLVNGKMTALSHNTKIIEERIEGNKVMRKYNEKVRYYLFKDNVYFQASSKKEILNACKDHKKEVLQFLSKNKLKYRRAPEETIVAVAGFYNRL